MQDRIEVAGIEVDRESKVTITFGDGLVAEFDLMSLRLACPCATCRSLRDLKEDVWPRPDSPTPLRITGADLYGAWGLQVTWNDGHATGIYPFDALRKWAEGDRPESTS